ncbi:MAG TPA: hypothetical protein VN803_07290 [Gemmatimonadales bacterium]|nr:hypothetical protein [Gemmatimonadales bacterium]
MPSFNKTLFIVMVCLFIGVTALAYVWWGRNWAGLKADGQISYQNGQELGWSVSSGACVDTALARHRPTRLLELGGKLNEQFFLRGCLGTSARSPHLCDNVPSTQEGIVHVARWAAEECRRHELRDQDCPALLDVLSTHCTRIRQRP